VRLLIADLVDRAATLESFAALREDIADLSARLDDAAQTAQLLPHRRAHLMIVIRFTRALFDLHLQLVDDVERELGEAQRPRRA
jgi:hypothetical protein